MAYLVRAGNTARGVAGGQLPPALLAAAWPAAIAR
jgi:hypothetical protein